MTTIPNKVKERLEKGELALGLGLRQARTMDTGRILAACDFDFAFIDMEHGAMTVDFAAQLSVACHDAGVTPLVRVPGYEHYHATRILDAGGMGIVFPHVDTAEHARQLVSYCKYPPMGHRSVAGSPPQLGFRAMPLAEAAEIVNQQTMVVIMVETPTAIENAEAIAAVEGVDVVLIGSNDLMMEMGKPQQFGGPELEEAMKTVVAACRKHGKHPGFGGVYDEDNSRKFIELGMRFILSGGDLALLMAGGRARTGFLRGIKL
jgi:2-keto-3-deoxy-L-rhamnonate aldolase RhmA